MELWKFYDERVKIQLIDGKILFGRVTEYFDQEDTENTYDEILFLPDEGVEIVIGETEIISIEVIQ